MATPERASQLFVKLGVTRADQEDQHNDEAKRAALRIFGETHARILEMEPNIGERQRRDERDDLRVAPVPPHDPLAGDERGEDDEESCVDHGGRRTANESGNEDSEPARRSQSSERRQRPARHRQPAGPIRDRCHEKSGHDRADIAEDHFMRMPVHGRKGGRNVDGADKDERPQRDADERPNSGREKEWTEAAA